MAARRTFAVLLTIAALTSGGCATLLGPRNARRAGLASEERAQQQAPVAPDADLHPVIFAYRESLRPFLGASELAALDAVDWAGTARGDAERLRFLAADRAIRRVLPLVLEAEGSETLARHAARLRALPPLLNRDTDVVQRLAVIEAMVALDRVRRGVDAREPSVLPVSTGPAVSGELGESDAGDAFTDALARLPRERTYDVDPVGETALAEALAEYASEYARAHGVSELHGAAAAAAAADMVDVAFMVGRAMQQGAGREQMFEEALAIADGMCGAARRGERLPRLHREEPPARGDDTRR